MRLPSRRSSALAGAATVVAFVLLTAVVAGLPAVVAGFDGAVSAQARSFASTHHGWRLAWSVVTHSADAPVLFCAGAVVVGWLVWRHRYRLAALAVGATALAFAVRAGVRYAVARPRPLDRLTEAHGWAYPSGHTTAATVVAGVAVLLALLLGRGARVRAVVPAVAVGWAVLVGLSRVSLVAHWPTDVLAGWFLGAAVTCLAAWVLSLPEPVRELADDAGTEHVRHRQDVRPDLLVVRDAGREVAGQSVGGLGDLVRVGVPSGADGGDGRGAAGLGRLQQLDRDHDVLAQQRRQPLAVGPAVVQLDRVADVGLVAQQSGRAGVEPGGVVGEGHDRRPSPDDVVGP
ncbi:MAG TPA: phosphatase PAP2 family protein [Micromonosporaceae bacterium]|nr:phosphatase PAP2 family protein [Micromonosporaceae bacterium]